MSHSNSASILTIIAPEGQALLNDRSLSEIKAKLGIQGELSWLAEGEAVDLTLTNLDNDKQQTLNNQVAELLKNKAPTSFEVANPKVVGSIPPGC